MEKKYTPGPWKTKSLDHWNYIYSGNTVSESLIATVEAQPRQETEEANAKIIMLAPDMLDFIHKIEVYLTIHPNGRNAHEDDFLKESRDILKKATE